jgi:hypothetical protein
MLLGALHRVESGESDGIVVARLDRFGRSLTDSLAAIDRIQRAGGTFISVQDGLDLSTPTGTLVVRIMFSMAEWELDRIRSNWQIARFKAIERGVHVGSWPPFGYRRDEAGRLNPHRRNAPILIDLFQRRAAGESIRSLGRSLEARGVKTTRGNPGWSETSLRHIFANRVYLGELRAGTAVRTKAHEPLVDPLVWHAAQNPRVLPERQRRLPTLLGGLLRCAGCSMALHSGTTERSQGRRVSEYACHGRSGAGDCPDAAYIAGGLIEPYVERAFFARLAHEQRSHARSTRRLQSLRDKAKEAEAALGAYRDHPRLLTLIGEDRFEAGLVRRLKARDEAMNLVLKESRRIESRDLPSASQLERDWPALTIGERRHAISQVIDCVFVWRGSGSVQARTYVCYSGLGPSDLPRAGARRSVQRQVILEDLPPEPTISPPSRWSRGRIKRELREFLDGRNTWPSPNTFCRDGRGPLLARVMRTGGPGPWSRRLGVRPPQGRTAVYAWNGDDARAAICELARGRKTFPSRREFFRLGHGSLFGWMRGHGGLDYWAAEVGLPRPSPGPSGKEEAPT